MQLLGIELTDEQFDYLMCQQAQGKEIKVVNGKLVAVEHQPTQEELIQQQLEIKISRLTELTKDLAQVQAGLVIDDLEERKQEFRTLLNEVRVLQGKQPREIAGGDVNVENNNN